MIRTVDTLIYLDDVQYTRRDWRNRNLIAGPKGPAWLTIPVQASGNYYAKINEIETANATWWKSHQSALDASYRGFAAYTQFRDDLSEKLKRAGEMKLLSDINRFLTSWLFSILQIGVTCLDSSNFPSGTDKSERLVNLCKSAAIATYVTGPAAKTYLDVEMFQRADVEVEWISYEKLPVLPLEARAEHELSVVHTLFTLGIAETIRLSTFTSVPTQNH
jgi:hypothetical protein